MTETRVLAPRALSTSAHDFFITATGNKTANLGGLRGADKFAGARDRRRSRGNKTWRAYLSAEKDPGNGNKPTDARSRIGTGPWSNAKGEVIAKDLDAAARPQRRRRRYSSTSAGNAFRATGRITEPNAHDILTGSTPTVRSWREGRATIGPRSSGPTGSGGPLRRLRACGGPVREILDLELVTRERKLRRHRPARRRRPLLLLRGEIVPRMAAGEGAKSCGLPPHVTHAGAHYPHPEPRRDGILKSVAGNAKCQRVRGPKNV